MTSADRKKKKKNLVLTVTLMKSNVGTREKNKRIIKQKELFIAVKGLTAYQPIGTNFPAGQYEKDIEKV